MKHIETKRLVGVVWRGLLGFFDYCWMLANPARNIKREYLAVMDEVQEGGKAMMTIEDIETVRLAEKNYREWKLAVFFNVGPAAKKPWMGIDRNIRVVLYPKAVSRLHLRNALYSRWTERIGGEDFFSPMPLELRNLIQALSAEIPSKLSNNVRMNVAEWPSVDLDYRLNPKIEYIIVHILEMFSRCTRWMIHGISEISYPNVERTHR